MRKFDLITGKDRSYERSIYLIQDITEDGFIIARFVCFSGHTETKDMTKKIGKVEDYRLATPEEVKQSYSGPKDWKSREDWLKSSKV